MTRISRRSLLLTSAAFGLVAGCGAPREFTETSRPQPEGGVGGTGIVGVVTELGSVIVCGRRVGISDRTKITDALGSRSRTDLRTGHSLTIEAEETATGLVARRVHIDQPVIGVLESIAEDGRLLSVNGVAVRLEPGAELRAGLGDRVAVSGLWRGRSVIASRVDDLPGSGPSVLAGEVSVVSGQLTIQGYPVRSAASSAPAAGNFATAKGSAQDGVLLADDVMAGRFFGAAGPLKALLIEGYLEPVGTAPGYAISGLGHSFDPRARLDQLSSGRVLFTGAYTGAFAVELGLPLPEGVQARRDALPAGLDLDTTAAISTR